MEEYALMDVIVRESNKSDINSIQTIYNQGIEDRIATLETEMKDYSYMREWFYMLSGRYKVIVAENEGEIVGWASLNQYNNRCAYDGVADISIYISRDHRGKGIGTKLLAELESQAKKMTFIKWCYLHFLLISWAKDYIKKWDFVK